MSEFIDRNKLLKTINENVAEAHNERCSQLLEAILNAPTADVVAVVRCRDCKYFVDEDETDMLGLCTCKRIAIAYNGELYPERDFYCPYGERSENGK